MKTTQEIETKFKELLEQREKTTNPSAAREMLEQRARALGWVLGLPGLEDDLLLDRDCLLILNCVT